MKPGLAQCPNAVIVPHIASATLWTRAGMVSGLVGGAAWAFTHSQVTVCPTLHTLSTRVPSSPPRPVLQATLAACNVAATLQGHPVWNKPDVLAFVDGAFEGIPHAAPSIVNAKELGLTMA